MTEVGEGQGRDRHERSPPPAITPSAKRFSGPSNQDGRGRNSLSSLNDLATRRVATARFAEPLTPPLTVERNKSQYQQHGRSSSSPTLSFSPRAFYHVGIGSASPITPVRRQFSSPYLISRRRTLAGGRLRFNQTGTDEDVNQNADTDTKGDKPSREEEDHGTHPPENKGGSQDDEDDDHGDDDDDGDEDDFGDVTEDHDEVDHTTESFELIDVYEEDTTCDFKDETTDGFQSPLKSPSTNNGVPSPGSGSVELIQESREALIVRLSGLIKRISELPDEDELGNDNHPSLGALHIQVYEMEKILPPSEDTKSSLNTLKSEQLTGSKAPKLIALRRSIPDSKESTEPPKFWGSHTITVPNWLGSRFSDALLAPSPLQPETQAQETVTVETLSTVPDHTLSEVDRREPSVHSIQSELPSKPILVTKATQTMVQEAAQFSLIASETSKLTAELEAVFKSLQARREESAHLHFLLVERAEAAAGKILELEKDIADLQDELGDNESELKHLRLRLRAVETLCHEFVRCNAAIIDPDLVQSIETWKSDWAKLREKMALKRRNQKKSRRSDSGLGLGMTQDSTTASTLSLSSLGLNSPAIGSGRESGVTTPTITTPIRTIHRRR